jgi:hypothetical protein
MQDQEVLERVLMGGSLIIEACFHKNKKQAATILFCSDKLLFKNLKRVSWGRQYEHKSEQG